MATHADEPCAVPNTATSRATTAMVAGRIKRGDLRDRFTVLSGQWSESTGGGLYSGGKDASKTRKEEKEKRQGGGATTTVRSS